VHLLVISKHTDILFRVTLFVAKFIGIMSNSGMPIWQMMEHPKGGWEKFKLIFSS
jgi:hypothetical protein